VQIVPHPQSARLHRLIRAARAGGADAAAGRLFAGTAGLALIDAAFDLFECDALYELARDVRSELGVDACGHPLDVEGEVRIVGRGMRA
jgi:hypothetical protein